MSDDLSNLQLTERFLADILELRMSAGERAAVKKAIRLLATNDTHPSLRVHKMQGRESGVWTAYVNDVLRITFLRLDGGHKQLLTLTRHYDR